MRKGERADIAVIDPQCLDERVEQAHEAEMEGFAGLQRLVRRNPGTVKAVLIGGRLAALDDVPAPELGRERGFGKLLRVRAGS